MEHKSNAVNIVAELFERAERQAAAIAAQKDRLIELQEQLTNKYSTETHVLVSRETLYGFIDKFEELGQEFSNLDGLLDDINASANSINDDTAYNDARNHQSYAREYSDEIRDLLEPKEELSEGGSE